MFGLDNLVDMLFDSAMENLSRNERVIQLLKRLKLDPDHPPEDFTGVYQYALVEYGVGKPRPALEIFRQSEIQQLFREALEQNNPAKLLQHGEAFLADHPLQADLQADNIDVRREFYAFAAVFIEVAKRTRTPAAIMAEQKLESLHRQIASVQERLSRLPTIEGMRTEMARLASPASLALPGGASFGAEECKAFALAQQMRGWFETLGFRFEPHEVWQDDYFEWIINVPVRRGRYDRILVRGIDGEAGLRDVEALKQSVETHRTDEGWLVTARRISRAARDEVGKPENDGLGCYTLDELLDQDADFGGYLTWLEAEIQKRGIAEKYVPLACLKEEIDPDTKQRLGVSRYDDRDGWIDGYIDLWLDDPAKEHISVLGEFGTGKTWFALHYAWKALQRYREAQRRGLERPRLPLIIPLRDYAKAVSVESLFSEFFFRKHEIPIPGYSAFEQLNRMGKLLLIFDGFDEMAARVDRQEMINNFWELAKVVVPGAKVILTCRTEHFPEAKEGRALLNAELQASTRDLTGETPQFEVLELEKFNDGQIRQVLEHQAQPATVEQIMSNPQLLDLARRPVLTELILEALPDIEAGKPIDMSRVYLYAVRHKMERDIKAERTFTSMADKLYFMCELSWEMLSTDRMSINYREFPDRIRKIFGPAVQEEKDLDHWHYDMMGQTMLIRNAEGDYTPAHRSLLEFFVAYKFAAELGVLAPDFLEALQSGPGGNEINEHEDFTWPSLFEPQHISSASSPRITQLNSGSFSTENLKALRTSFGKQPLTKVLLELILPMLNNKENLCNKLFGIIYQTRGKNFEEVGYVGGNLITLLSKIQKNCLEYEDLSECVLVGSDFTAASLRFTNLTGANLSQSLFLENFASIHSVAFSPNDKSFAVSDADGYLYVWDVEKLKKTATIKAHGFRILSISYSPDGTHLASGSADRTIRIWNLETGLQANTFSGHTDRIVSVEFSPCGNFLASGSYDKTIRIWDIYSGVCQQVIKGHQDRILSITFNPKNNLLASSSADKTIRIWDYVTGQCIRVLKGHVNWVRAISWHNSGNFIASGSSDETIRIWNLESGRCIRIIEDGVGEVTSICFNKSSDSLISGNEKGEVAIFNMSPDHASPTELIGHQFPISSIACNSKGDFCITGSEDQTVKIWRIDTGENFHTIKGIEVNWVWSLDFCSQKNQLVIGSNRSNYLQLWNLKADSTPEILNGHTKRVWSVRFSPNGEYFASSSSDQTIRIWDSRSSELIKVLKGHSSMVKSLCFSPDGDFLLSSSGSADRSIKLWNVKSGQCEATYIGHESSVHSVDFSPNSRLFASGSYDLSIKLWSILDTQPVKTFSGHLDHVYCVKFSTDGKNIASGSHDKSIKIWDVSTGELISTLNGHTDGVTSVRFLLNNKRLVSASIDKTIRLWDLASGNCLSIFSGHDGAVYEICLNLEETMIFSGGQDETVRVWDLTKVKCIRVLKLNRPCEEMNIKGVEGLTKLTRNTLVGLGAIES